MATKPRHRLTCVCPKCKIQPQPIACSYDSEGNLFFDLICTQCLEKLTMGYSMFELMGSAIEIEQNGGTKPPNKAIERAADEDFLKKICHISMENDPREEE